MSYLRQVSTRRTPQSESIPGSDQVPNSAGGFSWSVDDWQRLERFLILGSEGGTYYIGERKLTRENADALIRCIKANGERTVNTIVDVSHSGRAPKNDPALFALAACSALGDDATRRRALDRLPQVARTGTHLFHFAAYVEQFRGWGRGLRKAVARWYNEKDLNALSYQAIKYRQRDGWTHRDLLRLAHPEPPTVAHAKLYDWICHYANQLILAPPIYKIEGFVKAQRLNSPVEIAQAVRQYGLPREALPTEALNHPEVWQALLDDGMPMHAMVRNLANMTRIGLLTPFSQATKQVLEALGNAEAIRSSRLHPIAVLSALFTYKAGHGVRGRNTWNPVGKIVDALDEAFYLSFGNVEPTGKNIMLAIDVSSSMTWRDIGVPGLTPNIGAACMAMVTANSGDNYGVIGFTSNLRNLNISPGMRLDQVARETQDHSFGRTDCAVPMLVAMDQQLPIDAFIVYTDDETWAGAVHPSQALYEYRRMTGREGAKLIVVGMVSNGFTIADPNDAGMLDVVGFDTAVPQVMSDFIRGRVI